MFAEFVVTYVPMAIAAVVLIPVLLVHVVMFIDSVRKRRWPAPSESARAASKPVVRRESRRNAARTELPVTSGGMGFRHGIAARRDDD